MPARRRPPALLRPLLRGVIVGTCLATLDNVAGAQTTSTQISLRPMARSARHRLPVQALLNAAPEEQPGDLLVRDRNYFEFRVSAFRFSPHASVEAFYDTTSHSAEGSYNKREHVWIQWWYTAGVQLPYERWFMLQAYYRRENCSTCSPPSWNAGGLTLNFFLRTAK